MRQRWRIVDAIAHHRHTARPQGGCLQVLNGGRLVCGKYLRHHALHAYFARDSLRGVLVVASKNHRFQPQFTQFGQRRYRAFLDFIRHRDHPRQLPIQRHQHGSSGLTLQTCDHCIQPIQR